MQKKQAEKRAKELTIKHLGGNSKRNGKEWTIIDKNDRVTICL